jgi:hypothetical protein
LKLIAEIDLSNDRIDRHLCGRPVLPPLMMYARSQIESVSRTLWSVMMIPIRRFFSFAMID